MRVEIAAGQQTTVYLEGNYFYIDQSAAPVNIKLSDGREWEIRQKQGRRVNEGFNKLIITSSVDNSIDIIVDYDDFIDKSGGRQTATGRFVSTAPVTTTNTNEVVVIPANAARREVHITNTSVDKVLIYEDGAPVGAGQPLVAGGIAQVDVSHKLNVKVPTIGGIISWVEIVE